ncbi:MAG TPA: tRNA (cytidine(34)-2'-O)-methyltransferase [Acholeplasma sp.]|nr:tRNA (cytidine(34)-2'-O)-methyltransferase [Acholeplasma sp.]
MNLNIVLFEPEIPQNTGNIMRTCVGMNAKLHLIEPLGFSLSEKYLKRSALDYIKDLDYEVYPNYEAFKSKNKGQYFFLTRYGKKTYSDFKYNDIDEPIYLVFGKESTGIDKQILINNLASCFRIPTSSNIRSLNLSNCVALVSYEVLRQFDFPTLERSEPAVLKGSDFLEHLKEDISE